MVLLADPSLNPNTSTVDTSPGATSASGAPIDTTLLSPQDIQNENLANTRTDFTIARHVKQGVGVGLNLGANLDLSGLDPRVREALAQGSQIPPTVAPNALSDVIHTVFNNSYPQQTPVGQIRQYEQNLMTAGYLPQDYRSTGVWAGNRPLQQASYQFGHDGAQAIKQGEGHAGSVNASTFFRLLDFMLPSHAIKGIEGLVTGELKSLAGTGGRLLHVFTKHDMASIQDLGHHWGTDALNVLSVVGLASGIGELADAAGIAIGAGTTSLAAAAGEEGGGFIAKALSRAGIEAGADGTFPSLFQPANPAELLAKPGTATRLVSKFLSQGSEDVGNAFEKYVANYRSIQQSPIGKIAGLALGATTRAGAFPWAASVLEPQSELGKSVINAPGLGKPMNQVVDFASMFLHPVHGLSPLTDVSGGPLSSVKNMTRWSGVSKLGEMVPLASTDLTDLEKQVVAVQAYQHAQAADEVNKMRGLAKALPSDVAQAHHDALSATAADAWLDAGTAQQRLNPDYANKAMQWGAKNPMAVENFYYSLQKDSAIGALRPVLFQPDEAHRVGNALAETVNAAHMQTAPQLIPVINKLEETNKLIAKEEARLGSSISEGQPLAYMGTGKQLSKSAQATEGLDPGIQQLGMPISTTALDDLKAQKKVLEFQRDRLKAFDSQGLKITGNESVTPMRMDAPTAQDAIALAERWKSVRGIPANIREQMNQDQLFKDMTPQLKRLGLDKVPQSKVADELDKMAKLLPHEVIPNPHQASELDDHGLKLVVHPNSARLIQPGDVNAVSTSIEKFRNEHTILTHLAGTSNVTPASINTLTQMLLPQQLSRLAHELPAVFGEDPYGTEIRDKLVDIVTAKKSAAALLADKGPKYLKVAISQSVKGLADLKKSDVASMLESEYKLAGKELTQATGTVYDSIQKAGALRGVSGLHGSPQDTWSTLRDMAEAMRIKGLPGIAQGIRSLSISDLAGPLRKLPGLSNIPENWGYLPKMLGDLALKFRYSMSPLFAIKQFEKTQSIGMMKEGLPLLVQPLKYLQNAEPGGAAVDKALEIMSRSTGHAVDAYDSMEKFAMNNNLVGFNTTNYQAAAGYILYNRELRSGLAKGLSETQADGAAISYVRDHLRAVTNYGNNQPIMKSLNFIFFPLQFEQKFIGTVHDYMSSEPVRAMMVHELMRRTYSLMHADPGQQSKFGAFVNKHAPILEAFTSLNPFAHGVGIPTGTFGPYGDLAKLIGTSPAALQAMLLPASVRGPDAANFKKLFNSVVPIINQGATMMTQLHNQWMAMPKTLDVGTAALAALGQGYQPGLGKVSVPGAQGSAPAQQINDGYTKLEQIQQKYIGISHRFGGLKTIQSFQANTRIPQHYKIGYQTEIQELKQNFPAWAEHAAAYANKPSQQSAAIDAILRQVSLHQGNQLQEGVAGLEAVKIRLANDRLAHIKTPMAKARLALKTQTTMRGVGAQLLDKLGPGFSWYWDHLGYSNSYGPLTTTGELGVPDQNVDLTAI